MKTHDQNRHLSHQSNRIVMSMRVLWVMFALSIASSPSLAEGNPDVNVQYKLSTGIYSVRDANGPSMMATDTNLRATSELGNTWLGFYQTDDKVLRQTRIGWDSSFNFGAIRLQPSLQSASGGFWGGSLGLETGEQYFVGAGIGRTNLRNYVNLNFDPNDSWSLSVGYRGDGSRTLSAQMVHDNRMNPDQQHVHFTYRENFDKNKRILFDLLLKSGTVDNQFIKAYGAVLGMDSGEWGLRFAYDPKVNFTSADMKRLILSYRF